MDDSDEQPRSSPQESTTTTITTPDVLSGGDDDIWASDNDHDAAHASGASTTGEALLSDLPTIKRQHMTDGYREGLSIGKAKVMQTGFDAGYPLGVAIALRAGKVLGYMEGVLEAKDMSEESKVAVKKILNRAKDELAITSLLKGMNDQDIAEFEAVPPSVNMVLSKWEHMVLESAHADEIGQESSKVNARE